MSRGYTKMSDTHEFSLLNILFAMIAARTISVYCLKQKNDDDKNKRQR